MTQNAIPKEHDPFNYKPRFVTQAFKVYAGGLLNAKKEETTMEKPQCPIDNAADTVFIHVSDLRRSAEWYGMVMGLPVLEERLNGGNIYWFKLEDGTGINLDDNKGNSPDVPHVLYMYKTDDIDEAYRYLERIGIETLSEIDCYPWGLSYFRFIDPDGNALMVTQSDFVQDVVPRLPDTDSPILNRMGGIFLNVTDMDRAIAFHHRVLGLEHPTEPHEGADRSVYNLPVSRGTGVLLDNNRYRQNDDYGTLFMLTTTDVDAAKAYLARNGVETFTDIERYDDLAFFTVKDPDDNVIMVCNQTE